MNTGRYSEAEIATILRQANGGIPIPELCRENGISITTFYKWRMKYGDMDESSVRMLKDQEGEISRLKRKNKDLSAQNEIMKGALKKAVKRAVRGELAREAVKVNGVSVGQACRTFGISENTYNKEPMQPDEENALVARKLLELTKEHKNWGFEQCFRHLRDVDGHGWNHKRVYRIYRELGLNKRLKSPRRKKKNLRFWL